MVDLHSHTDRSDGTLSPEDLVDLAVKRGLRALAITDHDCLTGYDVAAPYASSQPIDLVCGVELSAKYNGETIHVLGYFLNTPPTSEFRDHLSCLKKSRRQRNERLAEKLASLGLEITLAEAESLGAGQTGRPHFAQVLVEKGYATDLREAFTLYLDEAAEGFVPRQEATIDNVLLWINRAGGISSWAHPGRFIERRGRKALPYLAELKKKGLDAVEVFHRDHSQSQSDRLRTAASDLSLAITGGSDYHGRSFDEPSLGSQRLPDSLLNELRALNQG